MSSKIILSVQNLSYQIDQKEILKNISLELAPQKIYALLGQSGSGKSSLLKLIAGLLEPNSGVLKIEGQAIDPPSEKLIPGHPKIKMVKQDTPLFPNISLRENIEYELRYYQKEYQKERVDKLLKITRLTDVAHQLPRHSSQGEQQRTAIARAIAEEPSLLLLDEPFSNLDFENKLRLKEELYELIAEENMACMFVTHDISDVLGWAHSLGILQNGEIVQQDTPLTIYNKPVNSYVAGLTGNFNLLDAKAFKGIFGQKVKGKVLIRPNELRIVPQDGVAMKVVKKCQ